MSSVIEEVAARFKVDFGPRHRQPLSGRVVLAALLAIVASLCADALCVAIGVALFPGIKGYTHFRFSDYAKLTVIGVIIASAAWPVVTRISSAPRWLFFRLAIAVTLVLFLPDLYILRGSGSLREVGVLMAMHVPIAVVTYNLLVHVAPVRRPRPARRGQYVRT